MIKTRCISRVKVDHDSNLLIIHRDNVIREYPLTDKNWERYLFIVLILVENNQVEKLQG